MYAMGGTLWNYGNIERICEVMYAMCETLWNYGKPQHLQTMTLRGQGPTCEIWIYERVNQKGLFVNYDFGNYDSMRLRAFCEVTNPWGQGPFCDVCG